MAHLFITGLPRSGTTFTAKILSASQKYYDIGEPFLYIPGIDNHYPFSEEKNEDGLLYRELFDQIIDYEYLRSYRTNYRKTLKNKLLIGCTRHTINYWKAYLANLQGYKSSLLIKEPHGALISKYVTVHANINVLVLIRHPAAFVRSMHSLNWIDDRDTASELLKQDALIDKYLSWLPSFMAKSNLSPIGHTALLWRSIMDVVFQFKEELSKKNFLLKKHPDLCKQPLQEFKEIYGWANLDFNEKVQEVIRELTHTQNPTKRTQANPHQYKLRRNSKKIIGRWKTELEKDQLDEIYEVVEPIIENHFPEWRCFNE